MSLRYTLFILLCVIFRVYEGCPIGYTQCSIYNAYCNVNALSIVSYSNDNDAVYAYQETSAPIQCSNSQFGGQLGTNGICCKQDPVLNGTVSPLVGSISCNKTKSVWIDFASKHYWQLTNVETKVNNITFSTCSTGNSDFDTSLTLYNSTGTIISGPFCAINAWGYSDCGNCPGSTEQDIYTVPAQQSSAMSAAYIRVSFYSTAEVGGTSDSGHYDLSVTCKPGSATQTTPEPSTAVPSTAIPSTAVPSTTAPAATTLIPTSSKPNTSSPTGFSGAITTTGINVTMEQTVNSMEEQVKNIVFQTNEIILCVIGGICFVLVMASYIYSHCISCNDYYKVAAVVTASLQTMDMFSDVLFVVEISDNPLFIMYTLSIAFIVIPLLVSLFQLHHEIGKHWMKNDRTRIWIAENIKLLYALSILCGSTFSATDLCTSNMFNLPYFDMALTKHQLLSFKYKRVYSSVLLENIPQLFIQTWYIFHNSSSVAFSAIVGISMLFSVISIVIAVISMATQKKIAYSQDSVSIEFDVTGKCIIENIKRCKKRTKKIRYELSAVLGINSSLIEITRPAQIPNGIKLNMNIFVSNTRAIDVNYRQMMENAQNNGKIASILQKHWELNGVPVINNIEYQTNASKLRVKNTVIISHKQTKNEIMMAHISNTDADGNKVHIVEDDCVVITVPGFANTDDYSASDESQHKPTGTGSTTEGNCDNQMNEGNENVQSYLNVNSEDDQEIIGDDTISE